MQLNHTILFCYCTQEIEKKAKDARQEAKAAKDIFKIAKDEACKTRPGGKILCLRGFGVGY